MSRADAIRTMALGLILALAVAVGFRVYAIELHNEYLNERYELMVDHAFLWRRIAELNTRHVALCGRASRAQGEVLENLIDRLGLDRNYPLAVEFMRSYKNAPVLTGQGGGGANGEHQ